MVPNVPLYRSSHCTPLIGQRKVKADTWHSCTGGDLAPSLRSWRQSVTSYREGKTTVIWWKRQQRCSVFLGIMGAQLRIHPSETPPYITEHYIVLRGLGGRALIGPLLCRETIFLQFGASGADLLYPALGHRLWIYINIYIYTCIYIMGIYHWNIRTIGATPFFTLCFSVRVRKFRKVAVRVRIRLG